MCKYISEFLIDKILNFNEFNCILKTFYENTKNNIDIQILDAKVILYSNIFLYIINSD